MMTFEEAVEKMIEHCRQIVEETPEEIGWEFKEIADALSSPPARSARDAAIERTATLLRNRLRSIAEHPDFKTVFDIARAHGVPYAGPNWEGEERNLSETLAMSKGKENESWRFLLGEACCLGLQSSQHDEFIQFLHKYALHVTYKEGEPFCEDAVVEMPKGKG